MFTAADWNFHSKAYLSKEESEINLDHVKLTSQSCNVAFLVCPIKIPAERMSKTSMGAFWNAFIIKLTVFQEFDLILLLDCLILRVFFAWTNRESWNPWQREQKHFIRTFCITWHLQKGACSDEVWAWDHGRCVGSLGSGGGRTVVSKELCPYCWQSPPSTWLPCESARNSPISLGGIPRTQLDAPLMAQLSAPGSPALCLLMSHLRALYLTVTVSCLELSQIGKQSVLSK